MSSDVYVMPSVSEPFGISHLRRCSAVYHVSSLSSRAVCILDYAVKVDYWDVDATADAMYGLISYPALHQFLAEKGLEEVNNITWENVGYKGEVYTMRS